MRANKPRARGYLAHGFPPAFFNRLNFQLRVTLDVAEAHISHLDERRLQHPRSPVALPTFLVLFDHTRRCKTPIGGVPSDARRKLTAEAAAPFALGRAHRYPRDLGADAAAAHLVAHIQQAKLRVGRRVGRRLVWLVDDRRHRGDHFVGRCKSHLSLVQRALFASTPCFRRARQTKARPKKAVRAPPHRCRWRRQA